MIYSDMDMALLGIEEDASTPDDPKDIRPFIHKSSARGGGGGGGAQEGGEDDEVCFLYLSMTVIVLFLLTQDDDFDEDDDYEMPEWNIRKCAASGLDILSSVFEGDMLPVLLPLLQQRLNDAYVAHSLMRALKALGFDV